jgi:hypothetical protein
MWCIFKKHNSELKPSKYQVNFYLEKRTSANSPQLSKY